jgi:DNA repair protein RadC
MKPQWRKDMVYEIVSARQKKSPAKVITAEDAYNLLKPYWNAEQEHFIIITLNGAHKPIKVSIVSIGLVNRTVVHPREVFVRAIQDNATAIILCHNHPSGNLDASTEDREITERMCDVGELVGIRVIDHIIFSKTGYASLRKNGYFKRRDEE